MPHLRPSWCNTVVLKYRARCNKRPCQARKTLRGTYDPNDRVACHVPGCGGSMRIDVTRERDCAKDSQGGQPMCRCAGTSEALGAMSSRNAPHTRGTRGCVHHEAVRVDRSLAPVPKHSPRRRPYEPEGEPPF